MLLSTMPPYTFQSTLPRRERPVHGYDIINSKEFQSTLPRRERRVCLSARSTAQRFQSTLPRRERPDTAAQGCSRSVDFNPRSREGSDPRDVWYSVQQRMISIHAPAKGATLPLMPNAGELNHFNPRSREGSDFGHRLAHQLRKVISIHAPAKGATAIPVPVP